MIPSNIISLVSVVAIATLPSLIWLFFYLKEDLHPEPKYWIFIVFMMGVSLAPLVIFLEITIFKIINSGFGSVAIESGILVFVVAPLVEEVAKYGVVHLALNKNPVLDEPVDGMIYLIVSALGFAAIENVFAAFSIIPIGADGYLGTTFNFMSMRFVSAVALHGLASGIVGYFFAKYYFIKRKSSLIIAGLASAIIVHGIYNFLIIQKDETLPLILTGMLLGGLAVLVIYLFNRLKYHEVYQQIVVDEALE